MRKYVQVTLNDAAFYLLIICSAKQVGKNLHLERDINVFGKKKNSGQWGTMGKRKEKR